MYENKSRSRGNRYNISEGSKLLLYIHRLMFKFYTGVLGSFLLVGDAGESEPSEILIKRYSFYFKYIGIINHLKNQMNVESTIIKLSVHQER